VFALIARAHMEKYGTTEAQMAAVAVKKPSARRRSNPKAQFQKQITIDRCSGSAYVADPLKFFDCCPFSDGGAALVLASEEVARRHRKPVWVLGSAAASDWMLLGDKRDLSRVRRPERAAAGRIGSRASAPDVDVVELHDCFTIARSWPPRGSALEPGAGGRAAEAGRTSLGGEIPVNPSGGLKAEGHPIGATGAAQIARSSRRSAARPGRARSTGAKTGLTHTLGATPRRSW